MGEHSIKDLSLAELQERLNNMENDRLQLERALSEKRQQGKHELAEEIKNLIQSKGYDITDIIEQLTPKKRGVGRGKSHRSYIRYVDPANSENVYIRGVLPRWMKEQMKEKGLDYQKKEDREKFKQKYLEKLDG
jgi:DNA-binding protein H-NS